jgi:hypothetical protein
LPSLQRRYVRAHLSGHFDAVFLAAIWSNYPKADNLRRADGSGDGSDAVAILETQLRETIDRLTAMGITVIVFEEAPYPANYRPSAFARAVWRGADPNSAGISLDDYRKRNEPFMRILDRIDNPKLIRVSLTDELCRDHTFCPAVTDGRSNFIDASHFSTHGAAPLAGDATSVRGDRMDVGTEDRPLVARDGKSFPTPTVPDGPRAR